MLQTTRTASWVLRCELSSANRDSNFETILTLDR